MTLLLEVTLAFFFVHATHKVLGISVMTAIKKSTIIFCFSNLALNQWKEQIEKWTFVNSNEMCRFSSQHESEWNEQYVIKKIPNIQIFTNLAQTLLSLPILCSVWAMVT